MADTTIKFKRTTGNNAPAELQEGELAYAEGTNRLFIGTSAGLSQIKTVIDGGITQSSTSSEPTKVVLRENNAENAGSLTLAAPDLTESYVLTLPAANPTETKSIQVATDGTMDGVVMSYGDPTAGPLGNVGDVTVDDSPDDDFLLYNSGNDKWETKSPSDVKALIGVSDTSDVEYQDVTVNGTLDVTGTNSVDETTQLTVQDKMIELGVVDSPTDTTASGGGIVIPGATQKKLQWVNGTGWELVGGDLKIDSGDDSGTAINVAGSEVIKITVKTIVATGATAGEINLADAKLLHNYASYGYNDTTAIDKPIAVGVLDGNYTVTGDVIGDFDFGEF